MLRLTTYIAFISIMVTACSATSTRSHKIAAGVDNILDLEEVITLFGEPKYKYICTGSMSRQEVWEYEEGKIFSVTGSDQDIKFLVFNYPASGYLQSVVNESDLYKYLRPCKPIGDMEIEAEKEAEMQLDPTQGPRNDYAGCEGGWSEIQACAQANKQKRLGQ